MRVGAVGRARPRAGGRPAATSRFRVAGLALLLLAAAAPRAGEQDRVRWEGTMRNFAVYRPATAASGAPLLLALGNPGRSARYALDAWRETADREGFVVAAVSSHRPDTWLAAQDGSGLLRAVVRRVKSRHGIDGRRVYLFGSRGGAGFVLGLGLTQPRYFAAVASFGGDPRPPGPRVANDLPRALPIHVFHSKRMLQFDVEDLMAAAGALRQAGAVVTVERLDVGTDFERRGRKVAGRIWKALSAHRLSQSPVYSPSAFDR